MFISNKEQKKNISEQINTYINSIDIGGVVDVRKIVAIIENENVAIEYYSFSDVLEYLDNESSQFERELTNEEIDTFMNVIHNNYPDNWVAFGNMIEYIATSLNIEII